MSSDELWTPGLITTGSAARDHRHGALDTLQEQQGWQFTREIARRANVSSLGAVPALPDKAALLHELARSASIGLNEDSRVCRARRMHWTRARCLRPFAGSATRISID